MVWDAEGVQQHDDTSVEELFEGIDEDEKTKKRSRSKSKSKKDKKKSKRSSSSTSKGSSDSGSSSSSSSEDRFDSLFDIKFECFDFVFAGFVNLHAHMVQVRYVRF